jgi:hypothetical protein
VNLPAHVRLRAATTIVSGVGAGTLAFAARKQPDKATQLRRLGIFFFCMAGFMAVVMAL